MGRGSVLNAFLIIHITELKNIENEFIYKNEYTGISVPENIFLNNDFLSHESQEAFIVKIFFSDNCSACSKKEIENTKKLLEKYPDRVKIMYVSTNKEDFSPHLDIDFDYTKVSYTELSNIFSEKINMSGPGSFIISSNGAVLYYFTTEVFNLGLSDQMHQKLDYLLNNL